VWPASVDPQRVLVDVENGFHLAAVFGLHAAQAHDLADALGVVSGGAHIVVDVANILAEPALFLFEPLDAFDLEFQAFVGGPVFVGQGTGMVSWSFMAALIRTGRAAASGRSA
jgi:hypothetical protein